MKNTTLFLKSRKKYIYSSCGYRSIIAGFIVFLLFFTGISSNAADNVPASSGASNVSPGEQSADNYFAIVNGDIIPVEEFIYTYRKESREKFFHGKASQSELETFQKDVAEKLVTQHLLAKEAVKLGLKIDENEINQKLEKMDSQLSDAESQEQREQWQQDREKILPLMRNRFMSEELAGRLQAKIRDIKYPDDAELLAYYNNNKDKFTAPQQWDVSIILLAVDPSSAPSIWDDTVEQADKIVKKITKGESFEELAKIHSQDDSAFNGGNMGYTHIGMLGVPAQRVLNVLEVGEISEPVILLEGVAVFRLNGVRKEQLNPYEKVKERVKDLYFREQSENTWREYVSTLKNAADVKYGSILTNG